MNTNMVISTIKYAIFTQDDSSPAVIVWSKSIKACILFEGIAPFLLDKIGIPVQTFLPFNCYTHHAAVKLSVRLVTVVWS